MTATAVTVAAVGVSIVTVGALLAGSVLAVRLRVADVKADVEHVATLGCWTALAVSAGVTAAGLWGQVLS
ncbi:hypothetical protein [Rathayibacter sp. VKM Ac-2754]|uniref:hypothetical protein n=1 Tax=Rathayibacter sp. VKM Ac-2754 TaxID=2609251 RepID=UPI00135C9640|nr:hypothetical protein [Rathayibacter sp. VKM Ac-2754]MWV60839.1 hypothetical protein [Rathayibacter sp. VKM Ac-2754]